MLSIDHILLILHNNETKGVLDEVIYKTIEGKQVRFMYLYELLFLQERVIKLINRDRISSLDLAKKIGIDINDLHNIIVRKSDNYPQAIVLKLSKFFKVDYTQLLYGMTTNDYLKLWKKAKKKYKKNKTNPLLTLQAFEKAQKARDLYQKRAKEKYTKSKKIPKQLSLDLTTNDLPTLRKRRFISFKKDKKK